MLDTEVEVSEHAKDSVELATVQVVHSASQDIAKLLQHQSFLVSLLMTGLADAIGKQLSTCETIAEVRSVIDGLRENKQLTPPTPAQDAFKAHRRP